MEKLLILDGNSIINRAFYGIRLLTNKEGEYTNALYGFLNILYKFIDGYDPAYICVAFDLKKPTFRHQKYENYKAGRKKMPEELASQMQPLRDLLLALCIPSLSLEGFEADDIIGTIAEKCKEKGISCIIASGDKDALQLAGDGVFVCLAATKAGQPQTDVYTDKEVQERYCIAPSALIDLKGLMGDSSDNIPGVSGVGEKTAITLISKYTNLENLYANIDEIKGTLKDKLLQDKDMAFLSRELATIIRNVPIEQTLEDLRAKQPNATALQDLLLKYELKSFMKRMNFAPPLAPVAPAAPDIVPKIITEGLHAKACIEEILKASSCCYYILKSAFEVAGVCIFAHEEFYYFDFSAGLLGSLAPEDMLCFFESPIAKIGHNLKEDIHYIRSLGGRLCGASFDTAIAAYIAQPDRSGYDIGSLAGFDSMEALIGKGKKQISLSQLSQEVAASYAAKCCKAIAQMEKQYAKDIAKNHQEQLYYDVEFPLIFVLADMEYDGFAVDISAISEFGSLLQAQGALLQQEIFRLSGMEFNINSPRQLGEVLFEKLALPVKRKTKTGYSTDSDVLEELSGKHPIIDCIKEYRTLVKLKTTYTDGLLKLVDPKTGRVHTRFNQTVAVTGRISSTEPNLQNIPVRTQIGRQLRKMFTAAPGYTLSDADYSQIELRVLAHIANDMDMIDGFKSGEDIHTITASQIFNVDIAQVTPQMRSSAKAVNFGIVYGISDYALSRDLKVMRRQAKQYMEEYFQKYQGVRAYMGNIIETAKEQGYVTTLLGRRRYIPQLTSSKYSERSFGERVALNAPIQGSAADIIKIAMVKVHSRLKKEQLQSRLILQVHDELIVETHLSEQEIVKKLLKEEMEQAFSMQVALVAEVNQGFSWYDAK